MNTDLVVVCTPTCNRRFSAEFSAACMNRQTYPNIHWLVVDNSTSEDESWAPIKEHAKVPLTYIRIDDEKKPIGYLRNVCIDEALKLSPTFIAFWDDDDFYVPKRIETSVKALKDSPDCHIVGCPTMQVFLSQDNCMVEVGPYGTNHSTAATYLFRASICEGRRFDGTALKAEEGSFTRDWTLPMKMIPCKEILLVIGHARNTVSKAQILGNMRRFSAVFVNNANAKNIVRFQWIRDPALWECFCRTFSPVA